MARARARDATNRFASRQHFGPSWLAMAPTPVLQANPPKCLQRSRGRTANSGECPRKKNAQANSDRGAYISISYKMEKLEDPGRLTVDLNLLRTVERKLESKRRISSIVVIERSTFFNNRQLSQACAPNTWKSRVSSSVPIPVELRHPCDSSLAFIRAGNSC